jgi:hypothetical protein
MSYILPKELFDKDLFVYTVHPVAGNMEHSIADNLDSIDFIENEIVKNESVGIVSPWSRLCRVMDDSKSEERKMGIKYNLDTLKLFNKIRNNLKKPLELWLYGHKVSKGMWEEIELAKELDVKIRVMDIRILEYLLEHNELEKIH